MTSGEEPRLEERGAAAQRLVAAPVCQANHRLDGDREPSLGGPSSRSSCDAPGDDSLGGAPGEAARIGHEMWDVLGGSTLMTWPDQRVIAGGRSDKMSLSGAPQNCLSSRRTSYHGIPASKRTVALPRSGCRGARAAHSANAERPVSWHLSKLSILACVMLPGAAGGLLVCLGLPRICALPPRPRGGNENYPSPKWMAIVRACVYGSLWCRREDSNLHALTGTTP
jgi:hypothetical protein